MAVVFISPKERQKMFIIGITSVVGLFLIVVASIIFFAQPSKSVSNELVFNKPKVKINFDVFESEQFKALESFEKMKIQFSYTASRDGKTKEGYTSAVSIEEAKSMLEELGYSVSRIEEAEIGRDNPFESYEKIVGTTADEALENEENMELEGIEEPNYLN
jgi:hypothetical protein